MSIYLNNQRITPILGTILPDQTGQSGKFLTTNGTDASWAEVGIETVNILSTSGTITLKDNSVNSITPINTITFTLPTITNNTVFHQILVQVNMTTAVSIDVGTTYYFDKTAPDMSVAGVYNLIYEYDKANQYWVCGVLNKGAST